MNAIDGLKTELQNQGLVVDSPIIDGNIQRCYTDTTKKSAKKNGWYIGWSKFINGKDYISCSMGDWALSDKPLATYKSWQDDNECSVVERAAIEQHQAALQKKAEAEKAKRHKDAAKKASQQWLALSDTGNSDYLTKKGVKGYGIKYGHDEIQADFIAIPIRNHEGDIKGLQLIYDNPLSYDPTRNKTFTSGVEKKGHFHVIGELSLFHPVFFVEGYATGAGVHQATGYPVIVCFDAGNIKPVVESWRVKYPQQAFIVCADNDQWKESNKGVDSATDTAKAYSCYLAIPDFTGIKKKDWIVYKQGFMCFTDLDISKLKPTDFNDLHLLAGLDTVKSAINQASTAFLNMRKPTTATDIQTAR